MYDNSKTNSTFNQTRSGQPAPPRTNREQPPPMTGSPPVAPARRPPPLGHSPRAIDRTHLKITEVEKKKNIDGVGSSYRLHKKKMSLAAHYN
ncbi:hypothetical protein NC652_013381 [Populus alba x Populus x berolinensis]|nr:hypothetical protein NC652_013381 [Populus alba x Populus x berolinensis]